MNCELAGTERQSRGRIWVCDSDAEPMVTMIDRREECFHMRSRSRFIRWSLSISSSYDASIRPRADVSCVQNDFERVSSGIRCNFSSACHRLFFPFEFSLSFSLVSSLLTHSHLLSHEKRFVPVQNALVYPIAQCARFALPAWRRSLVLAGVQNNPRTALHMFACLHSLARRFADRHIR